MQAAAAAALPPLELLPPPPPQAASNATLVRIVISVFILCAIAAIDGMLLKPLEELLACTRYIAPAAPELSVNDVVPELTVPMLVYAPLTFFKTVNPVADPFDASVQLRATPLLPALAVNPVGIFGG